MTNSTKSAPITFDFQPEPSVTGAASAESPRFIDTRRRAAALLGISVRTLEKFRVCGGDPSYRKLGAMVLYALEDLDFWVAHAVQGSTSDPGPTRSPEPPPARVGHSRRPR